MNHNSLENFRAAMRSAGLDYAGPIHPDGRLHRFKAEGDRDRNSWYVLHDGSPAAGGYGCWKRSFKEAWHDHKAKLSQADWDAIRHRWQEADEIREQDETARQVTARKTAARILQRAAPLTAHSYLTAKGVRVCGDVREYRGALVLPLRDIGGELHSLQFIGADGSKKFLAGGRVAGCFFTLADNPSRPLVVCEGYATGASICEATGHDVLAAMNCGNLIAVAQAAQAKWPGREIIIAGDNDQWTVGNPGMTKAAEAAKAIGAKRIVPQFTVTTTKPTDFNDLHQLEGLNTVINQIEAATAPIETDEQILNRLAAMPPLELDRCINKIAEDMGVNVGTLRSEVSKRRGGDSDDALQGTALNLASPEPWPDVVNGADVLTAIADTFSRYVALPDGAADALALWVAHTHCYEDFQCSPRVNFSSPEKQCGKTTARDVVSTFVPRPLPTENLSVAVLFRVVASQKPTILADECDAWLRDNEDLRGLLNAGHRRGGQALRCEGEDHEVRAFPVFSPAVLCGIGSLPGTLHDRSIVIRLERAKPGELRERFDSRRTEREQELCRKLARWCQDNSAPLADCEPTLPDGAFNRLADNWRPLFAIAEIAGGDWPVRAAAAFAKLTSKPDSDAQGIGATLLTDIRDIFAGTGEDRMPSAEIVSTLANMEGREWAEFGRAKKPISTNQLAKLLKRFEIKPRTIKLCDDTTAKGYHRADFNDAFARYLPESTPQTVTGVTSPENIEGNSDFQGVTENAGLRLEKSVATHEIKGGYGGYGSENPKPESNEQDEVLRL